ncbi:amidohydrolase family protein [Novosphingobium sp.]|uniref:amidohydrolase family protein n=1 Tax=Novosphingobium sp. TaxID=1874826 RepID=UPI001ECC0E1D|nr:amidohydrolase family protein [Novosphingobium sp.]MBK6802496.1 CIA30 family protein [Novosphingobium sp.]MBK9009444.1 CIA30 family protein [Novosphingobium sp.]
MIGRKSGLFAGALAVLLSAVSGAGLQAQAKNRSVAIIDATIFDGTGKEPFRGTVIIRDGRIAAVGPDIQVPKGSMIIDADGKALLPGFFDVHTHWSSTGSPGTLPQIATAYISSGVTTVNDFHQQPEAFEPKRAWLRTIVAPHVNFVARVSTPGGHGADWADLNTTKWVATAESARRAVQALQPYRPDYIKAFTDGWRYGTLPEETSMNLETLGALTDEAHKHGQRVLTHTVTVERGKIAAAADVDVIAHSIQDAPLDDAAVAGIKAAGTFYAPTLAIYQLKPEETGPGRKDDPVTRQRIRKWGFAEDNLRRLFAAGVPIALGTDAGIGGARHGYSTLQEMELLVGAGLSPKAALLAGTANSALALGLAGDRGTIEVGKRADLVLIDGKPWETIADVYKIDRVFVDGQLAHGGGAKLPASNLMTALPAAPAADLIDDFERADGRSSLDTLRLLDMDNGVERSAVVTNLVPNSTGGSSLAIAVQMSPKDKPEGGVLVPLTRGSVRPVDVRRFSGIRLKLRGSGRYTVVVNTLGGEWTASVDATPTWSEIRVPFNAFVPTRSRDGASSWRGDDLLEVGVIVRRGANSTAWGEIDDLGFYGP